MKVDLPTLVFNPCHCVRRSDADFCRSQGKDQESEAEDQDGRNGSWGPISHRRSFLLFFYVCYIYPGQASRDTRRWHAILEGLYKETRSEKRVGVYKVWGRLVDTRTQKQPRVPGVWV